MAFGLIVLAVFAATWCAAGIVLMSAPLWLLVCPIAVSAACAIGVARFARDLPGRSPEDERRVGRLVGIWSAVEGVGMFLAGNLAINLHRPELVAAALCTVVGLHFYPLARGLPRSSYYVTATAMTMLGAVGLIAVRTVPPPLVCFGAALVLWVSAVVGIGSIASATSTHTKL